MLSETKIRAKMRALEGMIDKPHLLLPKLDEAHWQVPNYKISIREAMRYNLFYMQWIMEDTNLPAYYCVTHDKAYLSEEPIGCELCNPNPSRRTGS